MLMNASIYDFRDYRLFLRSWLEHQPSRRGQQAKLAQAAGISSTLMSLILKGDKHLTLEQAGELADFLTLNERETDYFFTLVSLGRAGSANLNNKLRAKVRALQEQSQKLSERIDKVSVLSDETKATFYSNWLYTAIMNLVAIEGLQTSAALAQYLNLPPDRLVPVVSFLREHGLIVLRNGRFQYGPANTHLGFDSPFVNRHHQNWRLRGFTAMENKKEADLFYTCPVSLSRDAFEEIRKLLPSVIEQVLKIVRPSPSEQPACLNMDWFSF